MLPDEGLVMRPVACVLSKVLTSMSSATYEPVSLFSASLCLFLYARSSMSHSTFTATPSFRLDDIQIADPKRWIREGGPSQLEGIGDLASTLAPRRILSTFSRQTEKNGAVWQIGIHLAGVLATMALKE